MGLHSCLLLLGGVLFVTSPSVLGQTQTEAARALGSALQTRDESAVRAAVAAGLRALGDQAGVPEIADRPQAPARGDTRPLTRAEAEAGFELLLRVVQQKKWWRIGQDPTQTPHLPREVATVIEGCVAGCRVQAPNRAALLREAVEAGDYLLWTQQQAGTGGIPFPAVRGGRGPAFEAADRFLKHATESGRLAGILRNGWAIDDGDNGGLQFDNGLGGVALIELFQLTGEPRFRSGAIAAADWAVARPCVPNWNYNSFSVHLLARAFAMTGDTRHLEAAREKTRLGILPGQLITGPRSGRWMDAHNARPAYHYLLIRGLLSLLAVLPEDAPDRPIVARAIQQAMKARNPDFAREGLLNVDSAMEALQVHRSLPPGLTRLIGPCEAESAWSILESHCLSRLRRDQGPFSPGLGGRYFESVLRRTPVPQ